MSQALMDKDGRVVGAAIPACRSPSADGNGLPTDRASARTELRRRY